MLKQLQRIQNSAACLITQTKMRDHITPSLEALHWLPVNQRSKYKILLYTYKAINGQAPTYINELISWYEQSRPLRSASKSLLNIPRARTARFGDRCYTASAAKLWNDIPETLKDIKIISSFKKKLKTYIHIFLNIHTYNIYQCFRALWYWTLYKCCI